MNNRAVHGIWTQEAIREFWKRLTADDVASIAGMRDQLMQRIKARYEKTYGEIEREVSEFEFRDIRSTNAARRSRGIQSEGEQDKETSIT